MFIDTKSHIAFLLSFISNSKKKALNWLVIFRWKTVYFMRSSFDGLQLQVAVPW